MIWKGMGSMSGQMVGGTKDNIRMIRRVGMECITGLTIEGMMGIGSRVSSMAWANTLIRIKTRSSMGCGKREKD